jgi:hypothetical protein
VSDLISVAKKLKASIGNFEAQEINRQLKITISKHIVQSDLTLNVEPAEVGLRVNNNTASFIDVTHNGALELFGRRYLDKHDGLNDLPVSLRVCLFHGTLRG